MKKVILAMVSSLLLTVPHASAGEKVSDTEFNSFEEMQKMQQEMDKISVRELL